MTHEEREICLDIAKKLKEQLFPLPSKTEAKAQDEFIRKVCYATWSSIGHLAKSSLINSGLTFCEEYGFEQEWIPTTDRGLQLFKAYVDDVDAITLKEVVKLQEPFIYFLLWLVKVYKETD